MNEGGVITGGAEDYFVFAANVDAVIPGRTLVRTTMCNCTSENLAPQPLDSGFIAARCPGMTGKDVALRAQYILMHLTAVEMEERHRRVVAQGADGEAPIEFVQHVPGHRVQIRERL